MTIELKGYDISHWNTLRKECDFLDVAEEVGFVMLKAGGYEGGKYYKDPMFDTYYKQAKSAGLYVGAYFYIDRFYEGTYSALYAALYFMSLIKGKVFEMPLALDAEEMLPKDKAANTLCAEIFCEALELFGYYVAIYGSDISVFKDMYNIDQLTSYDKWVARYGQEPQYVKNYGMWQYTNNYSQSPFNNMVDQDVAFYNYPEIMKKQHLNGF